MVAAAAILGELGRGSVSAHGYGTERQPGVHGCLDLDLPWRVLLANGHVAGVGLVGGEAVVRPEDLRSHGSDRGETARVGRSTI